MIALELVTTETLDENDTQIESKKLREKTVVFEFPAAKVDKVSAVGTDSEAGMGGKDAKGRKGSRDIEERT